MKRGLSWLGLTALALACATGEGVAAADSPIPAPAPRRLSLDRVVLEALSDNHGLKAARAEWRAMLARVPQARAWEELRFGAEAPGSETGGRDSVGDGGSDVARALPFSGTNRWRVRAASAEAATASAALRRRELDVIAAVSAAYFRYGNATVQLRLIRRDEESRKQILEITCEQYKIGLCTQMDVLTAETGLARLHQARLEVERQFARAQTELNVLRNRPVGAEPGPPAELAFDPQFFLPPDEAPSRDLSTGIRIDWPRFESRVQGLALAHGPELAAAQSKLEAARARREAARSGWIPDPELRMELARFDTAFTGFSEVETGTAFRFPRTQLTIWRAAIEEAEETVRAAEEEWAALRLQTLGSVRVQCQKIETLQKQSELVRDRIIPLVEQAVQATQNAYAAGQVSVIELIKAQQEARQPEAALHQHLTDCLIAIAELEGIIGVRLDAGTNRVSGARPPDR